MVIALCLSSGCFAAALAYLFVGKISLNRTYSHGLRLRAYVQQMLRDKQTMNVVAIERHVPELSETIALGIRAGLSFDRSFRLYCERFDDELSHMCIAALHGWEGGFMTREEALRDFAQKSGSEIIERLVVNIGRSLSLGTSLARTLEILASEARSCHKAKIEEKIARVPVKMMIPTAVCVLPSMLIVILGPVLLGMM